MKNLQSKRVHSRLLRLQKRIYRALQTESERLLGSPPPSIRQYEREYLKDFLDLPNRPGSVPKSDLIREIRASDVTFIADYHTFAQAQRTAVRIVREAVLPKETWFLGVEMIPSKYQPELDAFQRGETSVERFLGNIRYAEEWGFPWENYAPLFEWAVAHGVRIIALNRPREIRADPDASTQELWARDRWAAGIITDLFAATPGKKRMIVLYGELHVGRKHLPTALTQVSKSYLKKALRSISIHQNNEALYWKLARDGREDRTEILRLKRGGFCVLSSTPWAKLQSLVTWAENGMPLSLPTMSGVPNRVLSAPNSNFNPWAAAFADDADDDDSEHSFDYLSLMQTYAQTIAEFLGLESPSFENIHVLTIRDADFIENLKDFSRDEQTLIRHHVLSNRRIYIPGNHIAYLASPSENGAAELASLHLLKLTTRSTFFFGRGENEFYRMILDSAFAFFGSLILNPRRKCDLAWDHQKRIAELGKKENHPAYPTELEARKLALEILEAGEVPPRLPKNVSSYFAAHYCGEVLGRGLHQAVLQGSVAPERIITIFFSRDLTRSKARYTELREAIAAIPLAASKTERL